MAWNYEKHRWECDRCGKKIDASQTIQLCRECAEKLKIETKKIKESEDK